MFMGLKHHVQMKSCGSESVTHSISWPNELLEYFNWYLTVVASDLFFR